MKRARETRGRRKIADMWRTQTERLHGEDGGGEGEGGRVEDRDGRPGPEGGGEVGEGKEVRRRT